MPPAGLGRSRARASRGPGGPRRRRQSPRVGPRPRTKRRSTTLSICNTEELPSPVFRGKRSCRYVRARPFSEAARTLGHVLANPGIRSIELAWVVGMAADWGFLVVLLVVAY